MEIHFPSTNEVITEIYNSYADTVYQVALVMLKSIPEAEDVTHNVFIKLMTTTKTFYEQEHIKAWLIVTAKNLCKDQMKSWWRTKRVETEHLPEAAYHLEPQEAELWTKLTSLPEKYRLPFYLYYYQGYKTYEIASMLNVKHATIRTRLKTAKIKLEILLKEDLRYGQTESC